MYSYINDNSIADYNMLTLYTVTYIIIKNKKISHLGKNRNLENINIIVNTVIHKKQCMEIWLYSMIILFALSLKHCSHNLYIF